MKHLFCVQSHITYLISREIILLNKLELSDVVFVITRNYDHVELAKFKKVDLTAEHDALLFKSALSKIWSQKSYSRIVDEKLKNVIDEKFHLYVPLIRSQLFQILATHKNCSIVDVIEEGTTAYASNMMNLNVDSNIKKIVKAFINKALITFGNRMFFVSHYDLSYCSNHSLSKFYCLSKRSFPGITSDKVQIELSPSPWIENDLFQLAHDTVVVLEGSVEYKTVSLATFLKAIEIMVNDIEASTVYIKYHPVQTTDNIKKIEKIFSDNQKELIVIPIDVAFEELLIANKNLKIYGLSSSLLLYSKILGASSFVYEDYLFKDESYRINREQNNYNLKALIKEIDER